MGKKVRMKWRKLDVVQQEERDNEEEVLDNENPFLKSINAAQQYTGAPIHYNKSYHQQQIQQHQIQLQPQVSEEYIIDNHDQVQDMSATTVYYTEPSTIQQQTPAPSETQYYNQYYYPNPHQQIVSADQPQYVYISPTQGTPQYMDAMTPSVPVQPVQYVPYYYYYPVPAENYSNMNVVDQTNMVNNNINNVNTTNANSEQQFKDQENIKSSISSSSECSLQNKVIRRRRKKKKLNEKSDEIENLYSPDIDSGYFNGPESSSELTSETDIFTDDDMKTNDDEKDITDLMIQQCSDPIIDVQFGDVQEILVGLSKTKLIEEENETEELKDSDFEPDKKIVDKTEKSEPTIHQEYIEVINQSPNTEETDIKKEKIENVENKEIKEIKTVLKSNNAKKKSKKKKQSLKMMSSHTEENPIKKDEGITLQSIMSPVQDLTSKPSSEWTEVKSFKKIKTISHQNQQQMSLEGKKSRKHKGQTENKPDISKITVKEENVTAKETERSLEDMKKLFFEEKTVQIVENQKQEETDKISRKKLKKFRKKNSDKVTKMRNINNYGEENPNLLMLDNFYNFEDFLMKQESDDSGKHQDEIINNVPSSGKITFLDPGFSPLFINDFSSNRSHNEGLAHRPTELRDITFIHGVAEQQLMRLKAITQPIVRLNKANPLILLRRVQSCQTSNILLQHSSKRKHPNIVRRAEIPGPRVKYLPATRMGILGVKREVVPPTCIIRRFGNM